MLMGPEERDKLFQKLDSLTTPVLFIGGCNQDIQSRPETNVLIGDSLPGSIEYSPGGVVRNIAENASCLGLKASLFAPVGDDIQGRSLLTLSSEAGVDTSLCPIISGGRTCSYAAFLDSRGEMIYAVNDMKLMDSFLPAMISDALLERFPCRVVDANLPEETLDKIADSGPILLADPVSANKVSKLRSCLEKTVCIKPNRMEAEKFCGFSLVTDGDCFRACDVFLNSGCESVFLSSGEKGFFCMNRAGERVRIGGPEIPVRSVTGAGDAASAALVLSILGKLNLKESAYLATLATAALLSDSSINPELSLPYLKKISKEYKL